MIIRDYAGEIPGIMKILTYLFYMVVATVSADNFCYQDTVTACHPTSKSRSSRIPNCHAKYGSIETIQGSLQHYANHLIYRSFNLLLMSTYYGNYIKHRPGFEKLYRSLSDSLWNDGIELIKYIDSRGGSMEFINIAEEISNSTIETDDNSQSITNWDLNELQSLAAALDLEKSLATEAIKICSEAEAENNDYDPEIAFFIKEQYLQTERDTIRKLAGYTHDLGDLLNTKDAMLAVYLFDEILQNKSY